MVHWFPSFHSQNCGFSTPTPMYWHHTHRFSSISEWNIRHSITKDRNMGNTPIPLYLSSTSQWFFRKHHKFIYFSPYSNHEPRRGQNLHHIRDSDSPKLLPLWARMTSEHMTSSPCFKSCSLSPIARKRLSSHSPTALETPSSHHDLESPTCMWSSLPPWTHLPLWIT